MFGREKVLPTLACIVTLAIYQTSPMLVVIEGAVSSLYVCDLLLPLLLFKALQDRRIRITTRNPIWIGFAFFLLIIPTIAGIVNTILIGSNLDTRSVMGAFLWFYRNINFLLILLYGLSLRLNEDQVAAFVRLNITMAAVLVLFGTINYWLGNNIAVFDKLLAVNDPDAEFFLDATRIGYGFLGLFRASVGQWGAITVVLLIGALSMQHTGGKLAKLAIAAAMTSFVLFSLSRAGVLGIISGLLVLSLLNRNSKQKLYSIIFLMVSIVSILFLDEIYLARISGILKADDISSLSRLDGWELAGRYLIDNPLALIFGIGPTNEQGTFNIIGTYGAHNEYVDTMLRMGILGLIVLFWLLWKMGRKYLHFYTSSNVPIRILGLTMMAVMTVNIISSITQNHLLHSYATYTLGIFIYWLYGVTLGVRKKPI